ncbi:hypothetical protein TcCL_Unassigned05416 [Trypanosoma cruzi]|nr:hypothetical protein TcCL_Unassigned05416 [Trypanosoma cruzi]
MRRVPCTVLFLALLCCFCSHVYATKDVDDDMVRVSAEVLCGSGNSSARWRLTGESEWKVCGPDNNSDGRDAMNEEDPSAMVCSVARPSCMDSNATSTSGKKEEFTFNLDLLTSKTTELYKRWESIRADSAKKTGTKSEGNADNTRPGNSRNESTAVSSPAKDTGMQSESNADSSDIITVRVHTPPLMLLLLLLVTATATAC